MDQDGLQQWESGFECHETLVRVTKREDRLQQLPDTWLGPDNHQLYRKLPGCPHFRRFIMEIPSGHHRTACPVFEATLCTKGLSRCPQDAEAPWLGHLSSMPRQHGTHTSQHVSRSWSRFNGEQHDLSEMTTTQPAIQDLGWQTLQQRR